MDQLLVVVIDVMVVVKIVMASCPGPIRRTSGPPAFFTHDPFEILQRGSCPFSVKVDWFSVEFEIFNNLLSERHYCHKFCRYAKIRCIHLQTCLVPLQRFRVLFWRNCAMLLIIAQPLTNKFFSKKLFRHHQVHSPEKNVNDNRIIPFSDPDHITVQHAKPQIEDVQAKGKATSHQHRNCATSCEQESSKEGR